MRSALRLATARRSSGLTTAKWAAVKPCLRAFWAERALPWGERGPVERVAFARLAARRPAETSLWGCDTRVSFRFQQYHGVEQESEIQRGLGLRGKELLAKIVVNANQRREPFTNRISTRDDASPALWGFGFRCRRALYETGLGNGLDAANCRIGRHPAARGRGEAQIRAYRS